jgi:hypothetical protein
MGLLREKYAVCAIIPLSAADGDGSSPSFKGGQGWFFAYQCEGCM